jgi:TolA-binding protein
VIDPPRLREGGMGASPELSALFRDAKKPDPLTSATDARLLLQVTAMGASPAAPLFKGWLIVGGAVVAAAALVLLARRAPAPSAAPRPPATHSLSAPIVALPPSVAPEPSPVESKPAPVASAARAAPAVASSSEDALAGEAKLLNQAHAAMATDPRKAYAFASDHAKRYPRGQLAAERELILVQALVKLGRAREAEARGHALRKSAPSSIYRERLDSILQGR